MRGLSSLGAWLGPAAVCLVVASACAERPIPLAFDPNGQRSATEDGLYRALDRRLAVTFVKPGARFDTYADIVIGSATVSYQSPPLTPNRFNRSRGNFVLGPDYTGRLKRILHESLERAVVESGYYELAQEAGPHTLRLVPRIVDLVYNSPPPSGNSQDEFVRTAGEMSLVVEIFDSETGERLALLAERRVIRPIGSTLSGFQSTAVTLWIGVRDVCSAWSQGLAGELHDFHDYAPLAAGPAANSAHPRDPAASPPDYLARRTAWRR
jgi:hypothetical protein